MQPDLSDIWATAQQASEESVSKFPNPKKEPIVQPQVPLKGPLKAPAAPATYKALKKIRLRVAPSKFADVLTSTEIEKDAVFRVLEAKEDEDGSLFLRTDSDYDDGWFMDKGIIGKFQGRKVIQRVAGSMSKAQVTVHSLSQVERAEVSDGSQKAAPVATAAEVDQQQKYSVQAVLLDPKMQELCKDIGIDPHVLKNNPTFLRAVARRLYGEEVIT